MADPFRDDLLIERVSGRLSPRVLFLCGINDCFPRESLFEGWEDTDKLSMMDVPGCDPEHFSAPDFFPRLSNMCLAINTDSRDVALSYRATPSGMRYLPRTVSSTVIDGISGNKRKSVFDVV